MKKNYFFTLLLVLFFSALPFGKVYAIILSDLDYNANSNNTKNYTLGKSTLDLKDLRIVNTRITTSIDLDKFEQATPQLTVNAFLNDFNYVYSNGGPSDIDNFSISGENLISDIVITAPTDFEISFTSDSGFDSTLSILPISGAVAETDIFVRLKGGLIIGNYKGDITISSSGVTDETIALNGNVYGSLKRSMIISGVYDGPLSGGTPKGIELYVFKDIEDLSFFGVSSVSNGFGSTIGNVEFTFPAVSVKGGTFIYVSSEDSGFTSFFGKAPDYTDSTMNINGDDAIELYENGKIIDVYGDVNKDFSGEAYDYLNGWAYRKADSQPGGTTFTETEWIYSGVDAFEGELTNAGATIPFPSGTFTGTLRILRNSIEGFVTYPNPVTNNQFTITTNGIERKKISIFNLVGKKVFESSFVGTKYNVDVSSISSGLYILKVTEGYKTATSKLMIE